MELSNNKTFESDYPTITFNKKVLYMNKNCIKHYPNKDYAQLIIDKENKILLVHPCDIQNDQAFPWVAYALEERVAKTCSCDYFCSVLYELMNWDIQSRYRIYGHYINYYNMDFVYFNLNIFEESKRTIRNNKITQTSELSYPIMPEKIINKYKDTYDKQLIITEFNDYSFYSIKSNFENKGDK